MNMLAPISAAQLPKTYETARPVVYFISNGRGRVKIGMTSDIQARVSSLQVGNHEALTVLRLVDGSAATERWFHKRFASLWITGEWFRYSDEMMTAIPPDEIPVREKITIRRDVGLTINEHLKAIDSHFDDVPEHQKLLMLISRLNDKAKVSLMRELREFVASRVQSEAA
jgi:hypothetical protein